MSNAGQTQVHLSESQHADAPDRQFTVYPDTTCLHPMPGAIGGGATGFYIKDGSLWLYDPPSKAWAAAWNVSDLPEGVWLRFTADDGHPVLPFELQRDGYDFTGRWLGGSGELVPLGMLDRMSGPSGAAALDAAKAEHESIMDSWMTFGGWQRVPKW